MTETARKPLGLTWTDAGDGWEYAWSPVEPDHPYLFHDCPQNKMRVPGFATDHTVTQREPLTLSPSIICSDCGAHGYIEAGKWRSV